MLILNSPQIQSKTSVIASMLAAGYVLGSDVLHKAKDYDGNNEFRICVVLILIQKNTIFHCKLKLHWKLSK